jgi:hypothetical protein
MHSKRLMVLYRQLLMLYPKQYRSQYDEQMLQTLTDMLADQPTRADRAKVWLRAGMDLQQNLLIQNIRNIGENYMNIIIKIALCATWLLIAAADIQAFRALRSVGTDWLNLAGGLRVIGLLIFCIVCIGGPFALAALALLNKPKPLYAKFAQ